MGSTYLLVLRHPFAHHPVDRWLDKARRDPLRNCDSVLIWNKAQKTLSANFIFGKRSAKNGVWQVRLRRGVTLPRVKAGINARKRGG